MGEYNQIWQKCTNTHVPTKRRLIGKVHTHEIVGLEEWISGASFYLSTVECTRAGEIIDEKLKAIFNRLHNGVYDAPKQKKGLVLKMSKDDA